MTRSASSTSMPRLDPVAQWISDARRAVERTPAPEDERDDLVQETLLKLWTHLREGGRPRSTSGLIRATVRHLRIDRWRRRRLEPRTTTDDHAGPDATTFDAAAREELRARVRREVDRLPDAQRDVVRMHVFEGKTFKEIAARQGVPLNTALGRMHLATKKLRERLEDVR